MNNSNNNNDKEKNCVHKCLIQATDHKRLKNRLRRYRWYCDLRY